MSVEIADEWSGRLFLRACRAMLDTPGSATDARVVRCENGELELRAFGAQIRYDTERLGAFGAAHRALHDCFSRFTAARCGGIPLYGALLAFGARAVALFAPATIGKSLLALHAAICGARFLGDELLVFYPESGLARALPRLPALREPALKYLPAAMQQTVAASANVAHLPGGRFWYALEKRDVLGIAPGASAHRLHAAVFLSRTPGALRLSPLRSERLLPRMTERAYRRPESLEELARFRASLAGVRGYELELGEPAAAAHLLSETFA